MNKIIILLMIIAAAYAESSSDKVIELFEVMKLKETMSLGMRVGMDASSAAFENTATGKDIMVKMKRGQEKMIQYLETVMGYDALKDELVKVYSTKYSNEELDALIAFFKSPIGSKFIDMQAPIMLESSRLTQSKMKEVMPRAQQIMIEEMGKM